MVMTSFGNCFSAGICLRIEMKYMPTGSVLQVFLQNVMCCSRYATFTCKHEKPGGWGYVNIGKPVMMVMYMFYASFSFCSQ